jgi:hypothetical protein
VITLPCIAVSISLTISFVVFSAATMPSNRLTSPSLQILRQPTSGPCNSICSSNCCDLGCCLILVAMDRHLFVGILFVILFSIPCSITSNCYMRSSPRI